jgi:hypothetical protein
MKFLVCIPQPKNYIHCRAFDDIADTVHFGLLALGHTSERLNTIPEDTWGRRMILFGPHLPGVDLSLLPSDTILYNLEQTDGSWIPKLTEMFQGKTVWDYSLRNVVLWKANGIRAVHVPIGTVPEMSRIEACPESAKSIDVLFYGRMNERRWRVIKQCQERDLDIVILENRYGEERDRLIRQSRVILNVHFYETRILEVVRISYLLANGACIVSEESFEAEGYWNANAIAFAPYEKLAETCVWWVNQPAQREKLSERARTYIRTLDETEYLKNALEETG